MAASAASIDLPYTDKQICERVSSGIKIGLDAARSRHDTSYGLWHRDQMHPTYRVFSSQLFYFGLFNAYFLDVADTTGLHFRLETEPPEKPDVLVLMDYKLNSWDDVGEFLRARGEVGFQEKLDLARSSTFSGCTAGVFHKARGATSALVVVNLSHYINAVRECLYKLSFLVFGFDSTANPARDATAMSLDLAVVAALYRLDASRLSNDKIEQSVLKELGIER